MKLTEVQRERILDRMVQRRLTTDRAYLNAENADEAAEREDEIELECSIELTNHYGLPQ